MKRTEFIVMMVFRTYNPTYRRVWTDGERFFVKHNGDIVDVTDRRYGFVRA